MKKLLILICLVGFLGACMGGPIVFASVRDNESTPSARSQTYSLVELSEMASEATVYIEAFREGESIAFGSGFVIDPEGIIVTNFHVLERADDALVRVGDTSFESVMVFAASEQWDLALLKIDGWDLSTLTLGLGIDTVKLGEEVLAVGNPEGLERTISNGIVSALRYAEDIDYTMIQTTAPISSGSSGGPLLNMRGEVIGVNTLSYTTGQMLNFAVPVDLVHNLMNEPFETQTIAERFSSMIGSSGYYHHQFGELAVVLGWEGNFDLDLEIWSEDFVYIGDAYRLNDSPDIYHGDSGEEWFIFQHHPGSGQHTTTGEEDFSQGRYVISPFFLNPSTHLPALATLTVYFRSGERVILSRELYYAPPYDQWFALLIDVDEGIVEILDFFDN